jgi:hypothetical protein
VSEPSRKDIEFLLAKIKENKASFYARRTKNRRLAFVLRVITVVLGAGVTIAVGARQYFAGTAWDKGLSITALALSALLPVVAACEAFFDPRWLWIQYTETLGRLYSISDDLDYLLSTDPEPKREKLDALYERLQSVLQETNSAWADKRLKDEAALKGQGRKSGT